MIPKRRYVTYGRPKGSGHYGEPTYSLRIPQSLLGRVQAMLDEARADHERKGIQTKKG